MQCIAAKFVCILRWRPIRLAIKAKLQAAAESRQEAKPVPVEVRQPPPTALENLATLIAPLIRPLTTTGITAIFVIFILLQREDLRNRFIKLAGSHDLQKTTAALDDAATRLSRLFLIQVALNAAFGVVIATGLWIIGIPSPVLWGVLAAAINQRRLGSVERVRPDEARVEANAGDPPGDLAEALRGPFSLRTNARVISRARLRTRDRDCALLPCQVRCRLAMIPSATCQRRSRARTPPAMGRSKDARTHIRRANRGS
jgi:hypothetical protein